MAFLHQLPNELIFKIFNFCDNTTLYTIRKILELTHYFNEIEKSIHKNNVLTVEYHTSILRNHLQKWIKKDEISYYIKNTAYTKTQFLDGIKIIVNDVLATDTLLVEYKKLVLSFQLNNRCISHYKQKILRRQLRYLLNIECYR